MVQINHQLVRRIFDRKYRQLTALGGIMEELSQRVSSRLDYIRIAPQLVIDCGSGLGYDSKILQTRYPRAQVVAIDSCLNLLQNQTPPVSIMAKLSRFMRTKEAEVQRVAADGAHLPIMPGTIDLFYSNLLLPYLADYEAFFNEVRYSLKVGGTFCIAGLAVDSGRELRELGLTSFSFPDMHDIGDCLVNAGFSNPVVDSELITFDYADLATLFRDVRSIGCGAAGGKNYLTKVRYHEFKAQEKLPHKLTVELFVAHGWKDQLKFADREVIQFMPKR